MSPRVPLLWLALLALLVAAAAGAGAAQTETPTNATQPSEETVIEIQLEPDGDARWTVTEQFVLTEESEVDAFDDLGEAFEAGATESLGLETFRQAAESAADESDRSMQIRNVERTASRQNGTTANETALNGTYSISFTWTNFAHEDGDSYVVDDAFTTSDGTWFGGLTADERLVIALPQGHGASAAPKGFEQNELRWEGPTSFDPGYLRIVYSGSLEPPNPDDGEPTFVWAALGVATVALVAAAALLARRRGFDPGGVIAGSEDEGDGGDGDEDDATGAAEIAAADEEEDLELLSDEERVERLLEQNGGRMKQANIVKETGWSNAKVSQLLSAMDEDDRIRKLRIGRENLISFPDEDVGEFET